MVLPQSLSIIYRTPKVKKKKNNEAREKEFVGDWQNPSHNLSLFQPIKMLCCSSDSSCLMTG